MRPRFEVEVSLTPDEVMSRFERRIADGECTLDVQLHDHQIELMPRSDDTRTWSPMLNLLLYPRDEGGCRLTGRFGPSVNVWTLFVAAYALCAFVGLTALVWASSQLTMGQSPTALVVAGAAVIGIGATYGLARAGRDMGGPQMKEIRELVLSVVGDSVVTDRTQG